MAESESIACATPSHPEPKQPAKLTELFADWQIVMAKDKSVETDTKGVYSDYPSHLACVRKVEELITGTKISYYQLINYADQAIGIETVITHACGEVLHTGMIYIPITKKEPVGIASAIGWAKRLSLVHAFSLGTLEREIEAKPNPGSPGLAPPFKPLTPNFEKPDVSRESEGKPLENLSDDLPAPTIEERIGQINTALTVDALNRLFRSFPREVREDKRIINACADRKIAMTEVPDSLTPLNKETT